MRPSFATLVSICLGTLAGLALLALAPLAHGAELPKPAGAFIHSRCADCHDAASKKGGLNLTSLPPDLDNPVLEAKWTYIFDRVERGEMPPRDEEQPPAAEREAFLKSLGGFLAEHDAARQQKNGRVVLRRLNRAEYENTIHDLLQIDTPLADLLPEDTTAYGFDNVSEALRLSATQIASYLEAADTALDAALKFGPDPRKKQRFSYLELPNIVDTLDRPHGSTNANGTKFRQEYGRLNDAFLLYINETFGATLLRESHAPVAGKYKVRISAFAHQSTGHPVVIARLMASNFVLNRFLAAFDLTPGQPRVAEATVWMKEGEMVYLSANGLDIAPDRMHVGDVGAENCRGPAVGVNWIEVEGPLEDAWPPPSVRRVFADVPVRLMAKPAGERRYELVPAHPVDDASRVVTAFARRAFRRPIVTADATRYIQLATSALAEGTTFENAIRRACKAILTSPEFLFLQEQRGPLDDYALASRLSYFLWSTMPDDELLTLAGQGKLKDPATLRAQTERMLSDPRSHEFVKNFCGQWLNLRAIDATMPDRDLYPEFDESLRDAMVGETEAFFAEMLRSNLGAATLIDSDFAMLNRRLAEHYGIAGVIGEQFRKVPLPPGSHRGGVLTQASVLKVTANGTLSSPVVRGNWVLKRLLGRTTPPPPADAGSIVPDTRGATTIREQLAKHRRAASCAACHKYMDPPGFALESYDVIGQWRGWYRSQHAGDTVMQIDPTTTQKHWFHRGPPVDCSGELADGEKFANIGGLKKLLLQQKDVVARTLANNLVTYATGAGVTFADRAAVQAILDKSRPHACGLRTMVEEIVESPLFQTK